MNALLLGLQFILAAVLMWSTFCRMVKTNGQTIREIRWAIWFLFLAASLVLFVPIMPLLDPHLAWPALTTPAWVWTLLLLAIVIVQIVTRRHWSDSVPACFQEKCS